MGKSQINNNIRKLRFFNDEMTQQELADKIGVSRQTINSIEKNRYVPSTVLALKISEVFQKSVNQLFGLSKSD